MLTMVMENCVMQWHIQIRKKLLNLWDNPENNGSQNFRKRENDKSAFRFNLLILHRWIRCLEYLLHLSNHLDVNVWQMRAKANKLQVATCKREIHRKLKIAIGFIL